LDTQPACHSSTLLVHWPIALVVCT
jgi:hypothetical protein